MKLFNNQFDNIELENKYLSLYRLSLQKNLSSGLISSFVLWGITLLIINYTGHELILELSLAICLAILPYFSFLLINQQKAWVKTNIEFLLASTNTVAGILYVYVLFSLSITINYILPGIIFIIFFAMLSYQFRPKTILFAALPYVLMHSLLLYQSPLFGYVEVLIQTSFSACVLLFAAYIASIIQKSNREKFIQDLTIKNQIEKINEKNKEVEESIVYAKRIQKAILPSQIKMKELLPNSFTVYLPKDIVAGDFYWMTEIDDQILFAAADCTGHGVPGAMVSVICNSGLNRSVQEFKLKDPGKILNKTRELVIREFEKSEEEIKDGMDIALCSLNGSMLSFAGAHNPLWIIRNGSNEVEEIKANKQPIGKFDNPQPYTTHNIDLTKGDTIYVFSDGFIDQFGGEKEKKYKSGKFKKFLLSIKHEPIQKHEELIFNEFEKWRGEVEQIDDVCVIGVRI